MKVAVGLVKQSSFSSASAVVGIWQLSARKLGYSFQCPYAVARMFLHCFASGLIAPKRKSERKKEFHTFFRAASSFKPNEVICSGISALT